MDHDILKFFGVMATLGFVGVLTYGGLLVVHAVRRRILSGRSGAIDPGELDALRAQAADVEALHARVEELEQRLDFAERLLARHETPRELAHPTPDPGR